jgi:DNA-binding IclR family transcriptional regulator
MLVLGAALQARFDLRPIVRPSLVRLAAVVEDTAILSIPSGAESVCVDVQLGSFPIRANYLDVGSRRPLGVGAGSLALLAWMPDHEIEAILPIVAARLGRYPRITPRLLEKQIAASRERGYVVLLDVVVERMGGVAMPIPGPDGRPAGAISIAALTERITRREGELAAALKREVAACSAAASGATVRNGANRSRSHSISPRRAARAKP